MDLASVEAIVNAISNIVTIAAPLIVKAEQNAEPFAKMIYGLITGKNITNNDIDMVLAQANALSAQIQSDNFIEPIQSDDV